MQGTGSPRQIHVYAIERLLATGGVGSVYLAHHQVTQMPVALKVMRAHGRNQDAQRARFLREVRAAARIGHSGIVRVYDAGETEDGDLYLAMELLEGRSLEEAFAQETSARVRVGWMAQILEPLKAAHEEGIVHRDLKPANVFLVDTPRGTQVKLLDFGIAWDARDGRVTQTGIMLGTPYYMSPEQALSPSQVGPESDIWSFGVMLYEALTGEVPFLGETPHTVVVRASSEPHPALLEAIPDLMPELADLVDACLEKDPAQRLSDASVVLERLRPLLGHAEFEDNMAHLSTVRELNAQRQAVRDGLADTGLAVGGGALPAVELGPRSLNVDALDTVAPLDVSLRRARRRYSRLWGGGIGIVLLSGVAGVGAYYFEHQRGGLDVLRVTRQAATTPSEHASSVDELPDGIVPDAAATADDTATADGNGSPLLARNKPAAPLRPTPDPHAPDPHAPDPHAPDPHAPDPHAPDPHAHDGALERDSRRGPDNRVGPATHAHDSRAQRQQGHSGSSEQAPTKVSIDPDAPGGAHGGRASVKETSAPPAAGHTHRSEGHPMRALPLPLRKPGMTPRVNDATASQSPTTVAPQPGPAAEVPAPSPTQASATDREPQGGGVPPTADLPAVLRTPSDVPAPPAPRAPWQSADSDTHWTPEVLPVDEHVDLHVFSPGVGAPQADPVD